jgi:23S rRNA pseudouridine2605 synthase
MRLNRYLSQCGLGSRRHCEALIVAERVRVNGAATTLTSQIAAGDRVEVDGKRVQPTATGQVWMMHKPAGVVTTVHDPQGRPTVVDLARECGIKERLYPVGRLDRVTTGLLLLTDNGDLCYRLTHPSWEIDKEYVARVRTPLTGPELAKLRTGIDLEDGRTAPCRVTQEPLADGVQVRLILHEGRNRQVRRMLQAVGHRVTRLHRLRIGPLRLGDLEIGQCRPLRPSELADLETALALHPAEGEEPGTA